MAEILAVKILKVSTGKLLFLPEFWNMRIKLTLFFLVIISFDVAAQRTDIRRKIDSLYQNKWDSAATDLDSLTNPRLVEIPRKNRKDTILIRERPQPISAPENLPVTPYNLMREDRPQKWYFFGKNALIFNQAAFSNWYTGGNNNIGVIGRVDYNLSYKNGRHFVENIIKLGYGFVNAENQGSRKTEDVLSVSSNYGYDMGRNVYISAGYQFLSQFSPGYNYSKTSKPKYADRVSKFMAPGYLNVGMGASYNPSENLQIIFRPANGKFTFVLDEQLQQAGRFGLERDGQSVRSELGAMLNFIYRLNIIENISYLSQLNFFSNYLHRPDRVDIHYAGALNLKVNKLISAAVNIDLAYDHDQIEKLQVKQTLGISLNYNVGTDTAPRPSSKKVIKPFVTK